MNFHYERELTGEGVIHKKTSPASGTPLQTILQQPLSLGVKLLIYAGVADILTAAHGANELHGDMGINNIFLTKTSVIVDGFGQQRMQTRAPEGSPIGFRKNF